jgi:hypothetical protein
MKAVLLLLLLLLLLLMLLPTGMQMRQRYVRSDGSATHQTSGCDVWGTPVVGHHSEAPPH